MNYGNKCTYNTYGKGSVLKLYLRFPASKFSILLIPISSKLVIFCNI